MSDREKAMKVLEEMPDNVNLIDIIETLYLKVKAESSMEEVRKGNYTSHEDLKKELEEW